MRQLNQHSINPGIPDLWVDVYDDAKRKVPATTALAPDGTWLILFDNGAVTPPGNGLNVRYGASGYVVQMVRQPMPADDTQIEANAVVLKEGTGPFPSGVVNRGPLPPFPPGSYDSSLWFQPPALADVQYWRCNFGCVTIPDLPWIPGMEDRNFDRVLTGFFGRYPADWQQTIIRTYRERGYTHFLRWTQDELIGSGLSVQQYVDQCKAMKDGGIAYVAHSFLSKTYAPQNPGSAYCHEQFDAVIDALLAAECLDAYTVGFELNAFTNDPVSNDACIDYFTVERGLTEATGHPAYVHFFPGYTWQGTGARDRRSWWELRRGKLTGLLYQSDPAWDVRMAQDRYKDTTDNAGEGFPGTDSGFGHPFDFVPLETQLERAFGNNADLDENDLDLMGYLSLCTTGGIPCMGFGCGARRPDGSYL